MQVPCHRPFGTQFTTRLGTSSAIDNGSLTNVDSYCVLFMLLMQPGWRDEIPQPFRCMRMFPRVLLNGICSKSTQILRRNVTCRLFAVLLTSLCRSSSRYIVFAMSISLHRVIPSFIFWRGYGSSDEAAKDPLAMTAHIVRP